MLKLDVPPNHFRRHFISNRSHKVSITSAHGQASPQAYQSPFYIAPQYLQRSLSALQQLLPSRSVSDISESIQSDTSDHILRAWSV